MLRIRFTSRICDLHRPGGPAQPEKGLRIKRSRLAIRTSIIAVALAALTVRGYTLWSRSAELMAKADEHNRRSFNIGIDDHMPSILHPEWGFHGSDVEIEIHKRALWYER
jgi:hypothetical protein